MAAMTPTYDAATEDGDMDDDYAGCPACGSPIDYCQGHGEIGDPAGFAILAAHDAGDHSSCHPDGCDETASHPDTRGEGGYVTAATLWVLCAVVALATVLAGYVGESFAAMRDASATATSDTYNVDGEN